MASFADTVGSVNMDKILEANRRRKTYVGNLIPRCGPDGIEHVTKDGTVLQGDIDVYTGNETVEHASVGVGGTAMCSVLPKAGVVLPQEFINTRAEDPAKAKYTATIEAPVGSDIRRYFDQLDRVVIELALDNPALGYLKDCSPVIKTAQKMAKEGQREAAITHLLEYMRKPIAKEIISAVRTEKTFGPRDVAVINLSTSCGNYGRVSDLTKTIAEGDDRTKEELAGFPKDTKYHPLEVDTYQSIPGTDQVCKMPASGRLRKSVSGGDTGIFVATIKVKPQMEGKKLRPGVFLRKVTLTSVKYGGSGMDRPLDEDDFEKDAGIVAAPPLSRKRSAEEEPEDEPPAKRSDIAGGVLSPL